MKHFVAIIAATLLALSCADEPVRAPGVSDTMPSMVPAGVATVTVDWFGEEGEELCGGQFILRAEGMYPEPDYIWVNISFTREVCGGYQVISPSPVAFEYGPVPRQKYKTEILNINDYEIGAETFGVMAHWYTSGWESGGCLSYQSVAAIECGGGGGEDPPPWEW